MKQLPSHEGNLVLGIVLLRATRMDINQMEVVSLFLAEWVIWVCKCDVLLWRRWII